MTRAARGLMTAAAGYAVVALIWLCVADGDVLLIVAAWLELACSLVAIGAVVVVARRARGARR